MQLLFKTHQNPRALNPASREQARPRLAVKRHCDAEPSEPGIAKAFWGYTGIMEKKMESTI